MGRARRRSIHTLVRFAGSLTLVVLLVAGCSSDEGQGASTSVGLSSRSTTLQVDMIQASVAALEAQLGGPQRYFEVNASPTVVNLFVAIEGATQAVAYVTVGGIVQPPAAAVEASGPTFAAADAQFDSATVLTQVQEQLPTSEFRLFSITGTPAGTAQYQVTMQSSKGSTFLVLLNAAGDILGTDQSLDVGS